METEPTFSIVVPCYNYGHFLARTLESVRLQERSDLQVLLIDDASTDNTPEVARNYAGFVEYQRNEYNLGAGGAWRRGVERATGKYILKLDADDEWLPGFLDEIERAFEASPEAAIAITSVMVKHEATGELNPEIICDEDTLLDPDEFRSLLLRRFFFRMPGCALRRSCMEGHDGPNPKLFQIHDWEYLLRVTRDHSAVLIRKPLAVYREHSDSISALARREERLNQDIRYWISLASGPGERGIEAKERSILKGSLAILLITGLGSRLGSGRLVDMTRSYFNAVPLAASGGAAQLARLNGALMQKAIKAMRRR